MRCKECGKQFKEQDAMGYCPYCGRAVYTEVDTE